MKKTVGSQLRAARLYRDLSQDALAALSGVTQRTISLAERGRRMPSIETLYALADALKFEPSWFLTTDPIEAGAKPMPD